MTNIPNLSDGNTLPATSLFKIIGSSQAGASGGSVGSNSATITIAADAASAGVLILWSFYFQTTNTQGGTIKAELAIGPTGSEVMKIQKTLQSQMTGLSNPSHTIKNAQFLMWLETGVDFGVENTVIVGYSSASNASITNISVDVFGV